MDRSTLERLVTDTRLALRALPEALVDEAIEAISTIDDDDQRDQALDALFTRLIALGRGWLAVDVLAAISDDALRRVALAREAHDLDKVIGKDAVDQLFAAMNDGGGTKGLPVEYHHAAPETPDPELFPDGRSLDVGDPAALLRALVEHVEARAPRPSGPVLSNGFAPGERPGEPVPATQPLQCNVRYYYWLALQPGDAPAIEHAIDAAASELPTEYLPDDARLTVALFAVGGEFADREFAITSGQDVGELHVLPGGAVEITHQPASPATDLPAGAIDESLRQTRLFFPVRAPARPGTARLRCNIYFRETLVQSRLITVEVVAPRAYSLVRPAGPIVPVKALQSEVDYQLSHSLRPALLAGITPHHLSMMLGSERKGSHTFRFFGASRFKSEAVLDEHLLADLIAKARGALRKAAWGSVDAWDQHAYRYDTPASMDQLSRDLLNLAICGYRLYDTLINRLAGGYEQAEKLAEIMRRPGQIQLALERSPSAVVPMAIMYDQPLDTNAPRDQYRLCAPVSDALEHGKPLGATPCFRDICPSHDDPMVVCPSGFWGYRHALGMPLATDSTQHPPVEIRYQNGPAFHISVSTDPAFIERAEHEKRLQALRSDLVWQRADSRDETLRQLRDSNPHLVYFYCHGGISNNIPYLQVGPRDERGITRENLRLYRIRWTETRPLVFLNGCHTTALSPDVAMELVSAFIENTAACGVIGTEITVFEPLACTFAEAFYGHILAGLSVGEAVRAARLTLLESKNPLGLVYIPYVLASARLQHRPGTE